ncbi:MAG: FmdB family zinc ribbon protein [Planctomycetota bacterium]|jgi:hypothetical protein
MAVAIRWSLAAVGAILIILGMIWVYAPGTRIFAWDSAGFMGTPVLPTDEWNYYAAGVTWLGLSLLTQWFFLRPRGGLALREESKGRSMRFATFGAGFCAMLITFGLIRILRALIAGTVLELLVAAPVHAACYKRDDCYCTRGSYTALVFGGTALFWVFGPGVFLLYLRERKRRGRLLRICPDCGHDLSGSAAETCPACGSENLGE